VVEEEVTMVRALGILAEEEVPIYPI